jgi:hypothetical protein
MSQIECQFCGSPDGPTQELPTEVLLRGIGNGVVPAVAAKAFRELGKTIFMKEVSITYLGEAVW